MLITDTQFQDVFSAVSVVDRCTGEVTVNLATCRFEDAGQFIEIYTSEEEDSPIYMVSKDQPKYPAQSLMKCLSLPHAFIMKNTSELNKQIIDEWKVRMKNPNVKLLYFTESGSTDMIVRGVVPEHYSSVKNSRFIEVVSALPNAAPLYVYGIGLDSSFMELRIMVGEPVNMGTDDNPDMFFTGLTILNSEVAACATEVHLGVFRLISAGGLMLDYSKKPFFRWDSLKAKSILQADSIARVLEGAHERLIADSPILIEAIRCAMGESVTPEYLMEQVQSFYINRKIPSSFIEKVSEEVELRPEKFLTSFDLVHYMTEMSQNLKTSKRLIIERFVPSVLGVNMVTVDNQTVNVPESTARTLSTAV